MISAFTAPKAGSRSITRLMFSPITRRNILSILLTASLRLIIGDTTPVPSRLAGMVLLTASFMYRFLLVLGRKYCELNPSKLRIYLTSPWDYICRGDSYFCVGER